MRLIILFVLPLFMGVALGVPMALKRCTKTNTAVRKEWGSLKKSQRRDYIAAVQCMLDKDPVLPTASYPGVVNRMGDFVAYGLPLHPCEYGIQSAYNRHRGRTHINMTLSMHVSGIFLAWHRHYIWLWEEALRNECGYKGYLPYWDWPLWAGNLSDSPIFDGSDTSLSGDGAYDPNITAVYIGKEELPPGTGGGCVLSGPFKDMQLTLGPLDFSMAFAPSLPENAFASNPRCFTRSLNDWIATRYTNQTAVDQLLATTNIIDFQQVMTMNPPSDFFASPADPAFMLFHGQVDRLWAIWQAEDEATRRYAVNGSSTIWYGQQTPDVTMDTYVEFGVLGAARQMVKMMDPTRNGYCYRYE
ncbi:domain di-copper centre [Penicillium paradoxum]|uniref:domain di-copper centre n=1 Tax=Penicillium paradoxum TaxID=176176 RepID=UPI0025467491|nr:domain di-copper centre [Penicillium paradoxum]KAJ5782240.1 domain di-copper centre [Penicillium paradoxum]